MLRDLPTIVLVIGAIPLLWSGVVAVLRAITTRRSGVESLRAEATVLGAMLAPVVVGAAALALTALAPTETLARLDVLDVAPALLPPRALSTPDPWPVLALAAVAVYAAGLGAAVTRLLRARARLRRIAATALPIPALGDDVRLTDESAPPFADSRGVIVLPRVLAEALPARDLALVVRHERAHVERGDARAYGALAWIDALCWHDPLVRRQTARCRLAAEHACDATVVADAPQLRAAYAGALVAALEHAGAHTPRWAPSIFSTRNMGEHHMRLTRIMSAAPAPRSRLARIAIAAAALMAIPVGGLQLAACAQSGTLAQVGPGTSRGVIAGIEVEGIERVEKETVLSLLTVSPGEPFDPVEIDASLRALFASGLFSDVGFQRRGDLLVVHVVESASTQEARVFDPTLLDCSGDAPPIRCFPQGDFNGPVGFRE